MNKAIKFTAIIGWMIIVFLTEEAQGKFCILNMDVKNVGDEAQTFFSSEQKLFNSEGQEFSNDTAAELSIDGIGDTWLEGINQATSSTAKWYSIFQPPQQL